MLLPHFCLVWCQAIISQLASLSECQVPRPDLRTARSTRRRVRDPTATMNREVLN